MQSRRSWARKIRRNGNSYRKENRRRRFFFFFFFFKAVTARYHTRNETSFDRRNVIIRVSLIRVTSRRPDGYFINHRRSCVLCNEREKERRKRGRKRDRERERKEKREKSNRRNDALVREQSYLSNGSRIVLRSRRRDEINQSHCSHGSDIDD